MKELLKILGIKDFIVWAILYILETLINLPFYIIKVVLYPFYYTYNKFFDKKSMFYLTKIKAINEYGKKLQEKCKKYKKCEIGTIPIENIKIPKEV